MPDLLADLLQLLVFVAAWVGHTCVWTALLNHLYGRPLPKEFLKPFRLFVGVVILGFPLLISAAYRHGGFLDDFGDLNDDVRGWVVPFYAAFCLGLGLFTLPAITLMRRLRGTPAALLAERTQTLDVWAELGEKAGGRGKWWWVARLPLNDVFRVDFTDLELAPPGLPPAWDGLTILYLSDLHFHGTPSKAFFERVRTEIETRWPTPDLVCLGGDYVDTAEHRDWIVPLLGPLRAAEARMAIVGNHDQHYKPSAIRKELTAAGYDVLGNGWREATIRGERCVLVGHEGPWFTPPPDLSSAPTGLFRLCLSHTPDNFYWGRRNGIGLMLCGHVHGGQVRVPLVGSIFVPSVYGRRFDAGVFAGDGTVMAVSRGVSGKEPLRFRCRPQVLRITLRAR